MLSGVLSSSPMLNLAAATGSFPFPTKFIALPPDAKVTLGLEQPAATSSRKAENMNGWFPHKQPSASGSNPIAPLPLSTAHAEVWSQGGKIFIRDLDSPFGTYVNDIKITGPTQLKRGDIISLGLHIPRNGKTPAYISDDELKPIIARVALTGTS
ncbi:hypothetical protein PC9H_011110 [Pleurotus ostreatus]|uniref:FHA domain-containing protein n=1 Tax=Pleurotus ostreatus TaxID=5322 RepID=A0A8H6ZP06_PLEOS|nr:uncharacterized protein PC9H_011110 [Pleurotus ostreatus]KAF7422946.1 hypothetical protein PC9H_011110 [Pleurotus ostreatus]KAJ8691073.1 hypothetical protein PTI98_010679 [Pleurotus ostreatus]